MKGGIYQGAVVGSFNSFFMFSYALALWCGAFRIACAVLCFSSGFL